MTKAQAKRHVSATTAELSKRTAEYVAHGSARAVAARGRLTIALSGGSMPKLLAAALIVEPLLSDIDWAAWHVFWADERCVPLTHPDSNYRLAREHLLDHVPIPAAQIYPIDDSLEAAAAAAAYQATLARVFQPVANQLPRFDLILLGLGEDGHTASLFPGHPLLNEAERWVAPIFDSPKLPPQRVTLTLPVINQARQVAFIASGAGKVNTLKQVLEPEPGSPSLPAQLVHPIDGELHWFVDNAAAAELSGR